MSDSPETVIPNKTKNMSSEMVSMLDNFSKKKSLSPLTTVSNSTVANNGLASRQNPLNSSSSNSTSVSKSSQQVSLPVNINRQTKKKISFT